MMAPFEGAATAAQQQSQASGVPPPLPRPPLPPGSVPSPSMSHHPQQQPMGGPPFHPGIHRQASSGMTHGGPGFSMPPQSPGSRQNSFSQGSSHHSGSSQSSYRQLHSPAHQQQHQQSHHQSIHPSQMHHSSGQQSHQRRSHPQHRGMSSRQAQNPGSASGGKSSDSRQQQYVPTGLNGNWQSDKDMSHRRDMIQHIVKMLKKDKNGSPEWLNKLPQMAKQLEVSLYRNARSFEAYADMSTLKHRLQLIAMEVSRKSKSHQGDREERQRTDGRQMYSNAQQQETLRQGSHNGSSRTPMSAQPQDQMSQQRQSASGSQRVVKMDEINPMAGGGSSGSSSYLGTSRGRSSVDANSSTRSPSTSALSNSPNPQNMNDPDWKIRIRHKQQRLLLLHHSAKCPHEDGRCTVTPHCADMKRLWRHMEGCKDNNCRVSHCFSSRAILSHYRKCKEPSCPACGPVRETVRKSQSKSGSSSSSRMSGSGDVSHRSSSGGHMMNPLSNSSSYSGDMRGMSSSSTPTQRRSAMPTSSDAAANVPGGSFSSSIPTSLQQPRQPSHSSMPPPVSGAIAGGSRQYSVSSAPYLSGSGSGKSPGSGSVQALYNPDPKSSDPFSPNDLSVGSSSLTLPAGNTSGGSSGGQRKNDTEWQKVRHKQQRLLLLRHASKCTYENGKCPVTPHCASMKKLWEHIAHCKNSNCTVQHCMSSRYVLSHYRRCKDARCPACGPVRDTIRKSHDKDKKKLQQNGATPGFGDLQRPSDEVSSRGDQSLIGSGSSGMSPTTSSQAMHYEPPMKKTKTEHSAALQSSKLTSESAVAPAVPRSGEKTSRESMGSTSAKAVKKEATDSKRSKPVEDHSLINSFTVEEIEKHVASLNRTSQLPPAKLKSTCLEVLKGLQTHQHGWVFNAPVDPVELGLPDYFLIITKPMDLGTVNKRLDNGQYHALEDFEADVNLTFDNAMSYNEEGSVVHDMAKELKSKFAVDYKKLLVKLEEEDQQRRQNDRACTLCGCEKLLFEPPVFFCNGMNCASKRIRRNSHFYVGGNSQYFWCNQCYNELDGNIPIELVDTTIMKNDLTKKKNDEVHEESWVQCDSCERWIHQICGLFNTRQNKEHQSEYCCPKCLLAKRKKSRGALKPMPRPMCAVDLPRTKLSEWLERHVQKKVSEKMRQLAEEKAAAEKIPYEDALKIMNEGGDIVIRQVTSTDRKLDVRERMKKRYAHKNYPEEFPFRCKCLVVFQNLDGVDVVLFALYVYEHGEDNPLPNKRVVYISYLDSVHFMRPRKLRTVVYHEILISYLDYVRQKGFSTAHIWACPPLKGDDYIFYAKPEDQKTPRDARLRQWYIDMLTECQRRNIAGKVTNMYDLYFADESLDATAVPYLEGDYFPGEAENIIKDIEEGGGKKGSSSGKKSKKKNNKSKSRGGTRSTGVDENALAASGILDSTKSLEEGGRDQVMVKMGDMIQPMKDSFLVAFLNWKGAREEDMVVPEAITKYRREAAEKKESSSKKRDSEGNVIADKVISIEDIANLRDKNGEAIKVIDDDVEDMDCEFFNNRQAFLNLCRGNHYQFDEMRRAKHTSMMVLWHLHNRDAPKFVQQCASCSREILTGTRYHCPSCADYDLCEECYKNPNANRGACTHKLQPISVESESSQEEQGGGSGLTEAQRKERQRNLQLHIQLIEHASRCSSTHCTSSNCAKMKSYLKHGRTCKIKASGGCKICKRIWTLLRIHAQKCRDAVCPIPQCMAIRERIRQLAKQQQAMDDRRRQEMNRHYRMNAASGGQ